MPARSAAERLRGVVETPSAAYQVVPGLTTGAAFVGWVHPDRFEIHVRQRNYNSMAPRAFGSIEAVGTGCRITVCVGASTTTKNGLAALIAFTGICAAPVLVSAGFPAVFGVALALILVGVSIYLLRARPGPGLPRAEEERLKELLDGLFGPSAQA
jgi:hypothetical protein